MLIISRRPGQRFLIQTSDGPIWITFTEWDNGKARFGIEADKTVKVWREELLPESERHESK